MQAKQEIYRPGTAISHASNLCIAVGVDQNKEFRDIGQRIIFGGKGPKGWNKNIVPCTDASILVYKHSPVENHGFNMYTENTQQQLT